MTIAPAAIQRLTQAAELDMLGHIQLFRGAALRGDRVGIEREIRLAHQALDGILGCALAQAGSTLPAAEPEQTAG
jgi:hypothetical protein